MVMALSGFLNILSSLYHLHMYQKLNQNLSSFMLSYNYFFPSGKDGICSFVLKLMRSVSTYKLYALSIYLV